MNNYSKNLNFNINNIIGGANENEWRIDIESIIPKDSLMKYPIFWDMQNNMLYRDRMLLKLLKLPIDIIKDILNKDPDDFINLVKCILVKVDTNNIYDPHDINLTTTHLKQLQKYKEIYNKHLNNKYVNINSVFNPTDTIFYVRDLINYFMEIIKDIENRRRATLDPSDAYEQIEMDFMNKLCSEYLNRWLIYLNHYNTVPTADDSLSKKINRLPSTFQDGYRGRIDEEYNKLFEKSITTYLKIRCEGDTYNERYNIFLQNLPEIVTADDYKIPQSLFLTGPNPNTGDIKFYDPTFKINNKNKNLLADDKTGKLCYIKKYDYGYLYGPFTRIFTPKINNSEISKKCFEILDNFNDDKSIFIIGYGASGAGKTSTLIYNKKETVVEKKNGILLEILKSDAFKFNKISITVHELYSDTDDAKAKKREYNNIDFIKDGTEFILDPSQTEKTYEYYDKVRQEMTETERKKAEKNIIDGIDTSTDPIAVNYRNTHRKWVEETLLNDLKDIKFIKTNYRCKISKDPGDKKTYFTNVDSTDLNTTNPEYKGKSGLILDPRMQITKDELDRNNSKTKDNSIKINKIGDLLITLVDRIRMVNPTTNNPTSSRSHVIIYIKVPILDTSGVETGKFKYLIFGDLAGVENKFTCDEDSTQAEFLKLKVLDRVTGDPLLDEDGKERTEPYYTTKKSKNFIKIEISDKILNMLQYLGYDSLSTRKESKFDDRVLILKRANGKEYLGDQTIPMIQKDLQVSNGRPESNIDPKIVSDFKGLQNKIMRINSGIILDQNVPGLNTVENLYIQKYYQELAYAYGLNRTLFPDFAADDFYRPYIRSLKNNDALLEIIETNDNVKKTSGVIELCKDRLNEGVFINNALHSMSENITKIIKKINSDNDKGLLRNVPLVNGSCFNYFCNKWNKGCFSVPDNENSNSDKSDILDDIKDVITDENYDKLQIVIFTVLNINRNANDPPKIPYIDINYVKRLMYQYYTYIFYNPEETKKKLGVFKTIFNELIKKNKLVELLDNYKVKIGQTNYEYVIKGIENINSSNMYTFFKNLNELIEKIDIINSLSVIGTLNFLNSIKNLFTTNLTCTLIDNNSQLNDIHYQSFFPEGHLLKDYINPITNQKLINILYDQTMNKDADACPANILMKDLAIMPESIGIVKPSTIISAATIQSPLVSRAADVVPIETRIGGQNSDYINKQKNNNYKKQKLINEYKKLYKMYKKLI